MDVIHNTHNIEKEVILAFQKQHSLKNGELEQY